MTGAVPSWTTPRTPGRLSFGGPTADLSAELGAPLMPWQQLAVDLGLEVDATGRLVYKTVVITTPRQAGKTTLLRAVLIKKAAQGREVWMTAQTGKHARRRWLKATEGVERILNEGRRGRTRTAGMVVKRNTGVGTEELRWLSSDGTLMPFAPNEQGLHGESPDDVSVDEAQSFTMEAADLVQAAYSPGFSTKREAQEWITSTAGSAQSDWLAGLVRAGRESVELGTPGRVAYVEYSCPAEVGGIPLRELPDDTLLDVIWSHHPADGFTLQRDHVVEELAKVHRGQMSRESFIRGYCNLQAGGASLPGAWPAQVWLDAGTELEPIGDAGLGIDVDPDGRDWAMVGAGRADGGQVVVEWAAGGPGQPGAAEAQLVKQAVDKGEVVGVQMIGSGAAADFADLLEAAGVPVERITAVDHAAAVSRMKSGIEQKRILHRKQPSLDEAQRAAVQRQTTDRRYWARAGSQPISALQAATLSVWALDHPSILTGPFKLFAPRRRSA